MGNKIKLLLLMLVVIPTVYLFFKKNKSETQIKNTLDAYSSAQLKSKDTEPNLDQKLNYFNLNDYELIGIIYSTDSRKSQVIIRIRKENSNIYKENEIVDEYIRIIRIQNESVLIENMKDQSIVKILNLKEVEMNVNNLNQQNNKQIIDNYENPSKAKYMEDAFRENYLKQEKTN